MFHAWFHFDVNSLSSFQVFCRFGVIEDIYMAVDDMKVSRGMSFALKILIVLGKLLCLFVFGQTLGKHHFI